MDKKIVVLGGIGIVGALILMSKKAAGSTTQNLVGTARPPIPDSIKQQNISKAGIAPEGYRLFTKSNVPKSVTDKCISLLSKPFGHEEYANIEGKNYFFRLEPHYHPLGYVGGPNGWHKGCTTYEALDIIV